jgi:hypothetical protein
MLIFYFDCDPKNGVLFVVQFKSINEIEKSSHTVNCKNKEKSQLILKIKF